MELDFEILNVSYSAFFLAVDVFVELWSGHRLELVLLNHNVLRRDVDERIEVGT